MNSPRALIPAIALLCLASLHASPAMATHSWGGYHWSRPSNPITVAIGDNLATSWKSYLTKAATDWQLTSGACNNPNNPIRTTVVAGRANNKRCNATAGRVEVCNGTYGNNGWLGIAGISVSGSHISSAYVKINDTYFNTATYNTPAWRQFVMSQEVGHAFGLDHQDTNFNNADLLDACGRGSCMDYTNDPTQNTTPNQHDYDELVTIYSHFDSAAFAPMIVPVDQRVDISVPSTWGQAMRFNDHGRGTVYERDFGGGRKEYTFILWVE